MESTVVGLHADYLCQVKKNTPELYRKLERSLEKQANVIEHAETVDCGHGRIETRSIEMAPTQPSETAWPHTHTACRVTRHRQVLRGEEIISESHQQALYVASFAFTSYTAEEVLKLTRSHWGIENCLHHRKDRSMNEDRCTASEKGIGRVMCCLRSLTAMIVTRSKESLSVITRRFSQKTHVILSLFKSSSLNEWETTRKPYKLASSYR